MMEKVKEGEKEPAGTEEVNIVWASKKVQTPKTPQTSKTVQTIESDVDLEDREKALEVRASALDSREGTLREVEHKLLERDEELIEREKALNDERNSFHKEQMLAWAEMRAEQQHIDSLWAKWTDQQKIGEEKDKEEMKEKQQKEQKNEQEEASPIPFHVDGGEDSPASTRPDDHLTPPASPHLHETDETDSDRELFPNPLRRQM